MTALCFYVHIGFYLQTKDWIPSVERARYAEGKKPTLRRAERRRELLAPAIARLHLG